MLVPAVLDLLGVPYTGSTALSLALALHKNKAKEILTARGVPTPAFCLVEHLEDLTRVELPFPLIVKPSREDASTGIDFDSVVTDRRGLGRAVTRVLRTFRQPALVEQYIDGREVYVPVLGNASRRSLPLTEIRFGGETFSTRPRVLSYRAKWHLESQECADSPSHPAELTPVLEARCVRVALEAFEALECRDYGRVDLRVDAQGEPFVIDINPNCDLHPQAGFARAAEAAGISYGALALHLVDLAWERRHGNQAPGSSRPPAARRVAGPHRDLLAGRGALRARAHRRGSPAGQP
jgi:D-alanine-D-alanine ligase